MSPFEPPRRILLGTALLALLLFAGCTGAPEPETTQRTDTETIEVPAGNGVEYKLFMQEGDEMRYQWTAETPVYYDFHGDREGADPDDFTSHDSGTLASDGATFVAPFTGRHGWYWEHRHSGPVEIELETSGVYAVVGYV